MNLYSCPYPATKEGLLRCTLLMYACLSRHRRFSLLICFAILFVLLFFVTVSVGNHLDLCAFHGKGARLLTISEMSVILDCLERGSLESRPVQHQRHSNCSNSALLPDPVAMMISIPHPLCLPPLPPLSFSACIPVSL